MAGKTFPGIGDDLGDEVPPLDPADAADSSSSVSYYSGPTVVDDAKVEQGLKKLRSLDSPPGPLTGIHGAVADAMSDAARLTPQVPEAVPLIPEITVDPSRGTAVGRSVSGPLPGQQSTQPFDDKHLRGTMFGHGVHLPDFDAVRPSEEVETSKALAVVERGKPTNHEIAVFQPGPYARYRPAPPDEALYPPRTNRLNRTPIEVEPLAPRRKIVGRILGSAAGIGLIVVGAILWIRYNTEDPNAYPKPGAGVPAARPIDLHPLAPPPPAPPAEAVPPPEATPPPQALVPPAQPAAAKPAPTPARDEEAVAKPVAAKPAVAPPAPAHRTHGSRRHAAGEGSPEGSAKPDQGDKPDAPEPRPTRGKKPIEEDPDATMAPTIE